MLVYAKIRKMEPDVKIVKVPIACHLKVKTKYRKIKLFYHIIVLTLPYSRRKRLVKVPKSILHLELYTCCITCFQV